MGEDQDMKIGLFAGALGVALAAGAGWAATPYRLVDLEAVFGQSEAFAIGSAGQIVGASTDAQSHFRAVVFGPVGSAGAPVPLPSVAGAQEHTASAIAGGGTIYGTAYTLGVVDPVAFATDGANLSLLGAFEAHAANGAGTVVGSTYVDSLGIKLARACRYANGSLVTLPTLGGQTAQAFGVDGGGGSAARVVGSASTADERGQRPCVWVGESPVDLGTHGGGEGQARAIRGGVVVGHAQLPSGLHRAMRWTIDASGVVLTRTDLGALADNTTSFALGLNDAGDIVGTSGFHAVMWPAGGGALVDLNSYLPAGSPWVLEKAWGISDAGIIVGRGSRLGFPRAFALVPAGAACPADLDDGTGGGVPDGGVTIDDLLFFLEQYSLGGLGADLDDGTGGGVPDGGVTIDDLLFFLAHYDVGC